MSTLLEHEDGREPLKVILVEDDDVDARAVRRAFDKAGVLNEILRVCDGVEALELLRSERGLSAPPKPWVLLVDINMPRMNGLDFVRELRADPALKDSVVFILTTSNLDEDKAQAYDLNVAGYIVKSRAGEEFLKLADLLGSYWRLVELPSGDGL